MITLTPAAARQIHAAFEDSDAELPVLRVAAHVNAAGEIEFGLGFDERREGDATVEDKGIELLIGQPSQELLAGTVLDFIEHSPGEFGFSLRPQDEADAATPGACAQQQAPTSGGCGGGSCGRCGG